ncbi:MAG: hypothetical protein PHO56_00320 [Patescibacteria group bacterium]|nr:hypothetical protein [Patescibacteria group bacterium]
MSSLKILEENEKEFAERFEKNLGRYWKRTAAVYHNYGDIFSEYIRDILRYCSLFGKETRERKFDVIISILEIHWETMLRRQVSNIIDPNKVDSQYFYLTISTFYCIYKKMRCADLFPKPARELLCLKFR